jgi:hypothetical protein
MTTADSPPPVCCNARVSDVYEPYERLIRIVVLGRAFEVPEDNLLLRQLQFVAPDIGYGRYCWNGECRYCEIKYRIGEGPEYSALACRITGREDMVVTKAAAEIRHNLSSALQVSKPTK